MTTLSDGAVVTKETFADGATVIVSSSSSSGGSSGNSSSSGGGSNDGSVATSTGDNEDEGVVCTNTNLETIPIPSTGFVDRACNVYGIQGSWYCFSDMATTTSGNGEGCIKGGVPVNGTPGQCLSGTLPASVNSYVGIGVSLNATGGANAVKSAYNATASGVVGFAITVTGTISGSSLRIGFTNDDGTTANYVAPFVSEGLPSANGTTYNVLLAGPPVPSVPSTFTGVADPGAMLDPTKIYDVQIEIPGQAMTSVTYSNFCVTNIVPIFNTDAASPGSCSAMVDIGGTNCSAQDIVDGVDYGFQNNISTGTGECVQAEQGGNCGGFTVTFPNGSFGSGGNSPSSYPSIIYGWSEVSPNWHGGLQAPKILSSITSAQTTWDYTGLPSQGDAAYDIWLSSSNTAVPNSSSGVELMIWTGRAGVNPAGPGQSGTATIGGNSWQVFKANSSNGAPGSWGYIAYVNTSASPSVDVNAFITDAVKNQNMGMSSSWYLWSIQAGWEVYSASSPLTTSQFSVTIN